MLRITKISPTGHECDTELRLSANASHAELKEAAAEYMNAALDTLNKVQAEGEVDVPEGAVLGHGFCMPPAEGYDQSIVYRFIGAMSEYAVECGYIVLHFNSGDSSGNPNTLFIAKRSDVDAVDDAYVIGQYTGSDLH